MVEMKFQPREADIVETANNIFFDVKGLVHPPEKVVAFIRFLPYSDGDREREGITYRKIYALSKRYALLKEAFPQYLVYDPVFDEHLCEVPIEKVKRHYRPENCLHDLRHRDTLDEVENQALQLMELLKENANVSWSQLGVSGSLLVKLHTSASDIDPIVYGTKNCYKVYSALRLLLKKNDSTVKPYNLKELRELFDFRSKDTAMSYEDFVRTESRKILQGKFMGRDYFIRFVKNWNEVEELYGAIRYKFEGYAKIKARVVNDSEAIFTPCCYKINGVKIVEGARVEPIKKIVSFRGRFCEQAKNGQTVIAQGKVEKVQKEGEREHYRLLLGSNVSDHMVLA